MFVDDVVYEGYVYLIFKRDYILSILVGFYYVYIYLYVYMYLCVCVNIM